MKKEKVIGIGVLLGIIILAVIVVVVAGNQRKNKTKTETENKTETETQMKSDSESESETETAPTDKESLDADELVEENFRQAGIAEYEKINLADYESRQARPTNILPLMEIPTEKSDWKMARR